MIFMIEKTNVLIFPSDGENSINIFEALKYNIHFELFGASIYDYHSPFIYDDNHFFKGDLNINNADFFDNFNSIISKYNIDYVICTHDEIISFLMQNESKINAVVCSSPYETCKIASNKKLTSELFSNKFYATKVYQINDNIEYPVFLKPIIGAGGKGTIKIDNSSQLSSYKRKIDKYIICEYLPGNEFTVDCFTNSKGELIFSRARTRERINHGLPYRIQNVSDDTRFLDIALDINRTLQFRGAWFFQLKEDKKNNLKLMEICVRQGGSMNFFREYGFNFPALTLFDFMGMEIVPIVNNYNMIVDRCLHNSFKIDYYYDKVYIDFDDTIIVNNRVNTTALKFLYQCFNKNKQIYLITKHSYDIKQSLKKYHIDIDLFDKIFSLDDNQFKYTIIDSNNSIFIDNYFKERYEVHSNLKIPVFDVDAIECLIDDSEI